MHILDLIILSALGYGLYTGFRKGLVHMLLSLAGLLAAVFLAAQFSERLIPWLGSHLKLGPGSLRWTAYLTVFLGTLLLVALISRLLGKLLKAAGLGWANRLSGAALSALKYLLILGLLLKLVDSVQQRFPVLPEDYAQGSRWQKPLMRSTDSILVYVGRLHLDTLIKARRRVEEEGEE